MIRNILIFSICLLFGASCFAQNEDRMRKKDDTALIQQRINTLAINGGGTVYIPVGVYFKLADLVLGEKVNLKFSKSSDLSPDSGHTKNSGEEYNLLSGGNKNGAVNEIIVASPYHPSLVVDVRKDLNGQDHLLKGKQQMDNPARASMLFRDEGKNQVLLQYKNYREDAKFAGFNIFSLRNVVVITGVGEQDLKTVLKVGAVISNDKKKAYGIVQSFDTNSMVVLWTSGRFRKGDKLVIDGKSSSRSITSVKEKGEFTSSLGLNRLNGYTTIGLPNGNAIFPLSVGGAIGIQRTRKFGQYLPEVFTEPTLIFADSFEKKSKKGFQISMKANSKQVVPVLKDVEGEKELGRIGAVSAHFSFDNTKPLFNRSFNIESVAPLSKGKYKAVFESPMSNNKYQVGLSSSQPMDFVYVVEKKANYLVLGVVTTGTKSFKDPEGELSVICIGGN